MTLFSKGGSRALEAEGFNGLGGEENPQENITGKEDKAFAAQ